MRYLLLIIVLLFLSYNSFSQTYISQLIDMENGLPIPYVNIGIINKNIGTVSNDRGWFTIELGNEFNNDSLRISCIGYESRTYLIRNFKNILRNLERVKIELQPKTYQLDEVIIISHNTKVYTLGNFCEADSPYGNSFYSKNLGTEMGVIISLPQKKKKTYLNSFRFYVGKFTYDEFPVRLNIYNLKDGWPFHNILKEQIFIDIKSEGEYIIDLTKYHIATSEDFFISLEYFRIAGRTEGELVFCALHNEEIKKGNGYYRFTSQGYWKREMFDNMGFSVQVECEE